MARPKKDDKPREKTKETKTHHQTGWHKPTRNPTTNAEKDSHKRFCRRCFKHNKGCLNPGGQKNCSL